jgi:hypothetical protein
VPFELVVVDQPTPTRLPYQQSCNRFNWNISHILYPRQMAPFPTLFKGAVVSTLEELRRRKVVSPLPPMPSTDDDEEVTTPPADTEATPPHWVCRVCGNPNHLSRQFCFMQVCGAPRGFPGPYTQAVRGLPGGQRPKRGKVGETPEPQRSTKSPPPAQPIKPTGYCAEVIDPRFTSSADRGFPPTVAAGDAQRIRAAGVPGQDYAPGVPPSMYAPLAMNSAGAFSNYAQQHAQASQPLVAFYNPAVQQPQMMPELAFFAR